MFLLGRLPKSDFLEEAARKNREAEARQEEINRSKYKEDDPKALKKGGRDLFMYVAKRCSFSVRGSPCLVIPCTSMARV